MENVIFDYISENDLLSPPELKSFKLFLNSEVKSYTNLAIAYNKLANKNNKLYFQEFLTIRNTEKQREYLKKHIGLNGLFNKAKDNKNDIAIKAAAGVISGIACSTFFALPTALAIGGVALKLSNRILLRSITNNFTLNNDSLEFLNKRINLANNQEEPMRKNELERLFKLIPNSHEFKKDMETDQKLKYFNEGIELYKRSDRKIKILLKGQDSNLLFNYISTLRSEMRKRNISTEQALSTSRYFTHDGLASIQSATLMKMLNNPKTLHKIFNQSLENSKNTIGGYVEDGVYSVEKIFKKNKIIRTLSYMFNPKDMYTDILSRRIDDKLEIGKESGHIFLNEKFPEFINKTINHIDNIISKTFNVENIQKSTHYSTSKTLIKEGMKDFTEELRDKLIENSLELNDYYKETLDYLDKSTFGNNKIKGNIKKVMETFINGYNDIKTNFNMFVSEHKTIEDVINKTKKVFKIIGHSLNKYLNFHDDNLERIKETTFNTINKSLQLISKEEEQFNENFKNYKTISKFDEKFSKKMSVIFKHHLNDLKDNIDLDDEQNLSWRNLKSSKI